MRYAVCFRFYSVSFLRPKRSMKLLPFHLVWPTTDVLADNPVNALILRKLRIYTLPLLYTLYTATITTTTATSIVLIYLLYIYLYYYVYNTDSAITLTELYYEKHDALQQLLTIRDSVLLALNFLGYSNVGRN